MKKRNLSVNEKIFLFVFVLIFVFEYFIFFNLFKIDLLELASWKKCLYEIERGVFFITHLAGSFFLGLFILYLFKPKDKIKKKKQLLFES